MAWQCKHSLFMLCTRQSTRKECALDVVNKLIDIAVHSYIMRSIARPLTTELAMMDFSHEDLFMSDFIKELCNFKSVKELLLSISMKYSSVDSIKQNIESVKNKVSGGSDESEMKLREFLSEIAESELNMLQIEDESPLDIKEVEFEAGQIIDEPLSIIEEKNELITTDDSIQQIKEESLKKDSINEQEEDRSSFLNNKLDINNPNYPAVSESVVDSNRSPFKVNNIKSPLDSEKNKESFYGTQEDNSFQKTETSEFAISTLNKPCKSFTADYIIDTNEKDKTEKKVDTFEEKSNIISIDDETKLQKEIDDRNVDIYIKSQLFTEPGKDSSPGDKVQKTETSELIISPPNEPRRSFTADYIIGTYEKDQTERTLDNFEEKSNILIVDDETNLQKENDDKNTEIYIKSQLLTESDKGYLPDDKVQKTKSSDSVILQPKAQCTSSSDDYVAGLCHINETNVTSDIILEKDNFSAIDNGAKFQSEKIKNLKKESLPDNEDYPLVIGHVSIKDEGLIVENNDILSDFVGKKESFANESEVKYEVSQIATSVLDKKESCKSFPLDKSSTVDIISEMFVDRTLDNELKSEEVMEEKEESESTNLNSEKNRKSLPDNKDYPEDIGHLSTKDENLIIENKDMLSDFAETKESFTKESEVSYEVSQIATSVLEKKESCKSFPLDHSSTVCIISEKLIDHTFDNRSKSVEIIEGNEDVLIVDSELKFDLCQTLGTTSVVRESSHGSKDLENYLVKDKIQDEPDHLNMQQESKPFSLEQKSDEDHPLNITEDIDEIKLKLEEETLQNDQISLSIIRENKDFMTSQKEMEFEACQTADIHSVQKQESYSSFKDLVLIEEENNPANLDCQNFEISHPLISNLEDNENPPMQNTDANLEICQISEVNLEISKESGLYFVLEDPFIHDKNAEKTENQTIQNIEVPEVTSKKSKETGQCFVLEDPFVLDRSTVKSDENLQPDQISSSIVQENKDFPTSKNEIEFEACQTTDLPNEKHESYSSLKPDHEIGEDNLKAQPEDQISSINALWISNLEDTENISMQSTDAKVEICQIPETQLTNTKKNSLSYVVEDSAITNQSTVRNEEENIQNNPMSLTIVQENKDIVTSHNEVEFEACQTTDLNLNMINERLSPLKADNNIEEDTLPGRLEDQIPENKAPIHYFDLNKNLKQMPKDIKLEICHFSDKVSLINDESFLSFNCENVRSTENASENKEEDNLEQQGAEIKDNDIDLEADPNSDLNGTDKESSVSINADLLIRDDEISIKRELSNLDVTEEDKTFRTKVKDDLNSVNAMVNKTEELREISPTNFGLHKPADLTLNDKKSSCASFTVDNSLITSKYETQTKDIQEKEAIADNIKYEASQTADLASKHKLGSCLSFSVDYLPSVEDASVKAEDNNIDVLLSHLIQNLSENHEENQIEPELSDSVDCNFCSTDDYDKDKSCVDDPCNDCSDHGGGFKQSSIGDFIVLICSEDSDEIDRQQKDLKADEPFKISIILDNQKIYTNQKNQDGEPLMLEHRSEDADRNEQNATTGMKIEEVILEDKENEYDMNDIQNKNKVSNKNVLNESVIEKVDNIQQVVYRRPINYQSPPQNLARKDSQVNAMKISNFCDISENFDESENLNTTTGFHMPNTVSEVHHRGLSSVGHSIAEDEYKSTSEPETNDVVLQQVDDIRQTFEQIFEDCSNFILEFTIEKFIFELFYSIVDSIGKEDMIGNCIYNEEIRKSRENINLTPKELSTRAWIGSENTFEQTLETNLAHFNELQNMTLSSFNSESQINIETFDSNTLIYAQITSDLSDVVLDDTILLWILKKQTLNEIVNEFLDERLSSIWSDIGIYLKIVISLDLKELQSTYQDCEKFGISSLEVNELSEGRSNVFNFDDIKREALEISAKLESSMHQNMLQKNKLADKILKDQSGVECTKINKSMTIISTTSRIKENFRSSSNEDHEQKYIEIRIKSECEIIKTISKHISSSELHSVDLINASINAIVDGKIDKSDLSHQSKSINRVNLKSVNFPDEKSTKESAKLNVENEEVSYVDRSIENSSMKYPSFSSLSTYYLADVSSKKNKILTDNNEASIKVYVQQVQILNKTIQESEDYNKIEFENVSILTSKPLEPKISKAEFLFEEALTKISNIQSDYLFYSAESEIHLNLSKISIGKTEDIVQREILMYDFYEKESLEIISENERINILALIETIIIEEIFSKYQMEGQSFSDILSEIIIDLESELWNSTSFDSVKLKHSESTEKKREILFDGHELGNKFKSTENESDVLAIDNYRNCVTEEEENEKDDEENDEEEDEEDSSNSYKTMDVCSLASSSVNNQNLFQNLSNKYNIFDIFSIDILRNSKAIILSLNSTEKAKSFLINRKPDNNFNGDNSVRVTQNLIRHLCVELNRNLRAQYPFLTAFKFAGYENHSNGKFTLKFSNKFSPFNIKWKENSGKYLLNRSENVLSIVESDSSQSQTIHRENSRNQITILCLWWLSGGICLLSFIYTIFLLFDSNTLDGNWT